MRSLGLVGLRALLLGLGACAFLLVGGFAGLVGRLWADVMSACRGSYRVNKIAWSEKVYRVASAKSGEMGARFGLEVAGKGGAQGENSAPEPRGLEVQPRLQRGPRLPPPF